MVELDEAKDKARRRSLGNIRFIGELFNLKMLTLPIMHDCVMKLLKERDEESMECLCMLLSTSGRNLDLKKAKVKFFCGLQRRQGFEISTRKVRDMTPKSQSPLSISLTWISTSIRWKKSSKREKLHLESVSCCKTSWTSER